MDAMISAAAQALAAGDPLAALRLVALREDASALALRGIAMAQLGELVRAKELLRRARRSFSSREAAARARCIVAEVEVALASRDLGWNANELDSARAILEARGDRLNSAYARYLEIRRLLLIGRLDDAEGLLAKLDPDSFPPGLKTAHELVVAGIAVKRLQTKAAQAALSRALHAAHAAAIPALIVEVENATRILSTPAACLIIRGEERSIRLEQVEELLHSQAFVVDSCRYTVRKGRIVVSLMSRPLLFMLAKSLAEAWPGDASRDELAARVFGSRFVDESHRVRLRVEVGRLRKLLAGLAEISATRRGFVLTPHDNNEVALLTQPIQEKHGAVLALLADGEAWSSSALALALGASQRSIQRALHSLAREGKVQSFGQARARRWITPSIPGFTTTLLLPAPLLIG
ncbi:MAG TPA: hypothetical protein VHB45_01710 [Alloacidobacterium sp.]|nr:hypothetical protein [Alloacidobacterium sp.]